MTDDAIESIDELANITAKLINERLDDGRIDPVGVMVALARVSIELTLRVMPDNELNPSGVKKRFRGLGAGFEKTCREYGEQFARELSKPTNLN